jgi:peptidoglycan/xylan/chitin deacetylase (PgdA/CDA1 family)
MNRLPAWQAGLMRAVGNVVSPGGRHGSLLVLMYHRVLAEPDPILPDEPDAVTFGSQMDLVAGLFQVVDLADAVGMLATGDLPARAVAITFDDGYANNLHIAAPILAERGLRATFFVATEFLDGSQMWNDTVIEALRDAPDYLDLRELDLGEHRLPDITARRQAVDWLLGRLKYLEQPERIKRARAIAGKVGSEPPARPMMAASEIRDLASMGMSVGAHSVSHPILGRLPDDAARREIVDSKRQLEEILRAPVRTFAYPNGRPLTDYDHRHVAMVRDAGFTATVSTAWGAAVRGADPHQIPRIAPWDRTAFRYGLRMLRGFSQRRPATA